MAENKQFVLLGTDAPTEREIWLTHMVNDLLHRELEHIALVGWPEDKEEVVTAYWNMQVFEKAEAASHLYFDAIDQFLQVNWNRYRRMEEDGELDQPEDDEEFDAEGGSDP